MTARKALAETVQGLPREFWWIWTSLLINCTGGFATPLLALYLTAGRGDSAAYAGLIVSLVGVGGVVGTLLGGTLADRVGRRSTMVCSHLVAAAGMAWLGLAEGQLAIPAAAFAMGLGSAAARPAMQAALADTVPPPDRERAFSLNYWAVNIGTAVAAVLAGVMVPFGYALVFVADGAATLLCALVIFVKLPETRPVEAADVPGQLAAPRKEPRGAALRDGRFVLFVLSTLLFGSVMQQWNTTLPIATASAGMTPSAFSTLIALNGILIVLLQIPMTRLIRGRSRSGVLLLAGLLMGWGFGINGISGGVGVLAVSVTVWTLGEILQAPVGSTVVADRAPTRLRGRYQGLYSAAWSGSAFLGPAAGGWVLSSFGADILWWSCGIVGTVAALGSAVVVRGIPRPAAAPEPAPRPTDPTRLPRPGELVAEVRGAENGLPLSAERPATAGATDTERTPG